MLQRSIHGFRQWGMAINEAAAAFIRWLDFLNNMIHAQDIQAGHGLVTGIGILRDAVCSLTHPQ